MKRFVLSLLCASALFASVTTSPHAAEQPPAAVTNTESPQLTLLPASQPAVTTDTPTPTTATLGLVDINRISAQTRLGKTAQTKIKEQQSKLQKQVDTKKRLLEKLKGDIERQLPTLTPPQREAKAKEFQKKVEE